MHESKSMIFGRLPLYFPIDPALNSAESYPITPYHPANSQLTMNSERYFTAVSPFDRINSLLAMDCRPSVEYFTPDTKLNYKRPVKRPVERPGKSSTPGRL